MTIVKKPEDLKKKGNRIFLVYGVDIGRCDDIIFDTQNWFLQNERGLETRRFNEDDLNNDFAGFEGAIKGGSLFGGASVGITRIHSESMAGKLAKFIEEAPILDGALFINGQNLSPKSKLVNAIEKSECAVALRIFESSVSDLIQVAKSIIQKEHVSASDDIIRSIIDNTAKDVLSVRAQLQSMCLYAGRGGTIDAEAVTGLLVNSRDGMLDDAVNFAFDGKASLALEGIYFCLRDGESPIRIFNLLIGRAKLLFNLISNLELGESAMNLVKERRFGIFWKQQDQIARQTENWARRGINRLLMDLVDYDGRSKVKGGSVNPELLLERCILRIAQLSGAKY